MYTLLGEDETMLARYGDLIFRRARLTLVLATAVLLGAAVLALGAFGKLQLGGFEDPSAESTQAEELIDSRFGGETNLVLLVHAKTGTVDSPAVQSAGRDLAAALGSEPDVRNVVSYWQTDATALKSEDGTDALILGHVAGDDNEIGDRAAAIIDKYAKPGAGAATVTVKAGGNAALNDELPTEVGRSLALAESIAIPLTMLLLVLAFGSVVAASLPLVIGLVAILGTLAELSVLGSLTDVSVFSINLTTALGLGLGIDFALLLVSRFREQLAAGDEVRAAVVRTVQTAGRTVLFSAATVAAALAALLVFPLFFLRSFAYAGIGVVAIAAVAALVIIPALLSVLGHRVDRGRVPGIRAARGAASPVWGRIARAVLRRPVVTTVPVLAGLLLAASPLLGITFGTPDQGVLPASASSRQVADALETRFAGNDAAAVDVVVDAPVAAQPLSAYAQRLSRLPHVSRVDSSAGTFVAGQPGQTAGAAAALGRSDAQRLSVVTTVEPKSGEAKDLVRTIRDLPGPDGNRTLVGGVDAQLVDTQHAIGSRLPMAGGLIIVTTFVLLFLFTGSLVQPVRALVLNALSLAATLGAMTWIFQDGHFSSLLGFTPRPMDMAMTVLLFCITFGLSMDYEVIVTSRIKEMHDQGASTSEAVVQGLARTGRIVSTAAALLAVTFFAFGTGSVSFLQMFGLGSGLAILLDATLVRGVLVPVVMHLLGRRVWYAPRGLRRLHARVALSEAS
jgi:putative drug exporter of the RND superfamily